jgi:nitroreductase / dihydropteridine reductase
MKTLQEALQFRSAVKEYNKEAKLTESEVDSLLDAVRMAPSSYGLQPYEVLVISNTEMRERLRAVSYNQAQVTDASHFVVFVSRIDENEKDVQEFTERIMKGRGVTEESLAGYAQMMNGALSSMDAQGKAAWAAKQAYLGLGILLVAAALAEIDASPMEGFDAKAYDEALGLTTKGYTAAVICALGKKAETDAYSKMPKVRKSKEEFVKVV